MLTTSSHCLAFDQKIGQSPKYCRMFKFLLTFFIDIITPIISSTQITCDVMCVQGVIY